jgi:hypothetical protein
MSLGQLNRLVQLTQTGDNPVKSLQLQPEEPAAQTTPVDTSPEAKV